MKIWSRRITIGLTVLFATPVLLWLSGYLLPSTVVLKTERQIDAPTEAVFELVNSAEGLTDWWAVAGEEMNDTFIVRHLDGPLSGPGMVVGFYSGDTLIEKWTYTDSVSPSTVNIEVDFQIFTSTRTITLSTTDNGTLFQWEEIAIVKAPHWRWLLKLGEESAIENRQSLIAATVRAIHQRH